MSDSTVKDVYAEVRKRGSSNSKIEKENFETLQAIEESIKSKGKGDLTPVKYFNALMNMLNTNTSFYRSLLYLLQLILPLVPDSAKQNKCSDSMEVLLQVQKVHKKTFEPAANRSLITCISLILKSQKPSEDIWSEKNVKNGFTFLLNQCIHKSPKIRHVAEDEIASLMETQCAVALSKHVISFLATLHKKYSDDSSKDITSFLSLIAKVILFIDPSQYDSLLSLLYQIRSHKINYLEYKSLHPIEIILSSESTLTLTHVTELLNVILAAPVAEDATDVDILQYVKTLLLAVQRLVLGPQAGVESSLLNVLQVVYQYMQSASTPFCPQLSSLIQQFYSSIKPSSCTESMVASITHLYEEIYTKIAKEQYISFIPTLSSFLQLIGESFTTQAQTLIKLLLTMYDECSNKSAIQFRPVIEQAFEHAVLCVPMDAFMKAVSIHKDNLPDESHYFLYHILEKSLCHKPCSLAFFFDTFSPVIKACQKEIEKAKNATQKRRYQINLADLFSILASCCVCAVDAAAVLPSYKKLLLRIMNDENCRDAGVSICKALTILIRSNQQMIERKKEEVKKDLEEEDFLREDDKEDDKEEEELEEREPPFMEKLLKSQAPKIDVHQAKNTLDSLAKTMDVFIEAGYTLFDHCHGSYEKDVPKFNGVGKGGEIAVVLALRYALVVMNSIAPAKVITSRFEHVLEVLKAEQTEDIRKYIIATGSLATLIPSLPSTNAHAIMECLSVVKEHLEEGSIPILQRRYYYCLLLLSHYHGDVFVKEGELIHTIDRLLDNLLTVNVLVRKYRIKSLFYLLHHIANSKSEDLMYLITIIPKFVLCIKDSNKVIRSICFDIIILMSNLMKNATGTLTLPDGSETQASLVEYFKILMGCLTSNTAHMKSASLMCISCILYHHRSNESIWPTITDLIHIVYTFLEEKSRELVKACFGFIRTCVKTMSEELLKEELHDIIVALLPWARESRNHFKARVRAIVELLVRRLGKTTILEQLPEEEKGLLDQILNAEPVKSDEQLVKEMEEEIEKFEPNEEDEQEVIEIDETGNVMEHDFAALLQEIANSEDLKRAVKRREMLQSNEEDAPSKRVHVKEEEEEMEIEEEERKL